MVFLESQWFMWPMNCNYCVADSGRVDEDYALAKRRVLSRNLSGTISIVISLEPIPHSMVVDEDWQSRSLILQTSSGSIVRQVTRHSGYRKSSISYYTLTVDNKIGKIIEPLTWKTSTQILSQRKWLHIGMKGTPNHQDQPC